jgi:hypothetical protein
MRLARCAADIEKYQNYAVIYFRFSRQNITEMRSYYIEMHDMVKEIKCHFLSPEVPKLSVIKRKKIYLEINTCFMIENQNL